MQLRSESGPVTVGREARILDGQAEDLSDEELMLRFCSGDASAFDQLFSRHASAVHGLACKIVGEAALAEDVVQVAFLSFVRARGRYQTGARVLPWLLAITANAARDQTRQSRNQAGLARAARDEAGEAATPPVGRDHALERRLAAALEQLPASQREAVALRLHGLDFAEIAVSAGTSVGAVKVRAHRGYQRLRQLLAGLEER